MKRINHKVSQALLELTNSDSHKALEVLYREYCVQISRYILIFVKSKEATEELLSDVFVAIWENRKELTSVENFNAYIYKIAKFKSLNHIRERNNSMLEIDDISIDIFACTRTTAEDNYISKELIAKLNNAITELPPRCQLAFKLIREDGMSYKEAAEHLKISVKTVENHMTLAMRNLIKFIKELR